MSQLSENRMALFNIASTALVAGINFITIPVFTRMLDTDGYGLVNVYTAWVQIFTVFVGLKADGSIGSAKANLPDREQDSYQFSILVMSGIVFAFITGVVLLKIDSVSFFLNMSPVLVLCMLVQSFGSFVISVFSMRFIFEKQAQKNLVVSVGLCVTTTVLSIALIGIFPDNEGYLGRAFGLMLPNALISTVLFFGMIFRLKPKVKRRYWRFCLTLTLPLIFHGLSQLLLVQTGKIAIQQSFGDSLAGVYSIAVVVVSLMGAIYGALNNAFVPFMYDDLAGKTSESIRQKHFSNYFVLFTLGTCSFALIAPELLKLMSTEAFWPAVDALPFLVFGQYCVFLYSFPVNYEFYKMKTGSIAIGTAVAAIMNVLLCVVLVPRYGIMSAAFSTMLSYIALFTFHFLIARFYLGDRNYPVRYFFVGFGVVSIACLACHVFGDYSIARWVVGVQLLLVAIARVVKMKSIF